VSSIYLLERPQMVSFLFAAILVAQLARVREGGRLSWPLPLLMMVWANMHGGFVIGDLVLLCFAAGAVIEYRHDLAKLRHLLLWVAIGIGASLLNPNGALVFGELLSFNSSTVTEFQSTWVRFAQGEWFIVILWLLIGLYGVGVWSARRLYWPELLVALFLAYFSVAYIRNVGFFAVAMLPSIGYYLQQGRLLRSKSITPFFKCLILLGFAALLLWQGKSFLQNGDKARFTRSLYPEAAAQFILTSGIQGRMFNDYDFGGYFIWKLYPQHRVFIDNRGLDANVFRDFASIMTLKGGYKGFSVLLDRYGIDYVVLPIMNFQTGRLTPLLKSLPYIPGWIPIYVDPQSYIVARYSPANVGVIERFQLSRDVFHNQLVGNLITNAINKPGIVGNHVALAEMLIHAGRYDDAESPLGVIVRMQPDNPELAELRNQVLLKKRR
jgi:hypothetical protein